MNHDDHSVRPSGTFGTIRRQPQPGDVLDGTYRIDSVLGYGGVGVVCAAWHKHLQRPCAVKFLHPQLVGDPELRARFRREAQSAFQLGHPHIVAITDFRDEPDGWPYIVMELVTGETLRSRLERGPLPPLVAVRLMIELCDALHTAHRRGVIHRDLKPENLFLTHPEGETGDGDAYLKVLDFGLSKILDESDITETGRLLGSPSYMSPEQARGDSHTVDARSDIFSVGALLYECLTQAKLFEAQSFEHKRQLIVTAQLPQMRFAQRGLPPQFETIIRTACALRPEDRYQSAHQMAEALAAVYPNAVLDPIRSEGSGRMRRPSGMTPALRTSAPMPILPGVAAVQPPPPPVPTAAAPQPSGRSTPPPVPHSGQPAPAPPVPAPPQQPSGRSTPPPVPPPEPRGPLEATQAQAPGAASGPPASSQRSELSGSQNNGLQRGELMSRSRARRRRTSAAWGAVIALGLVIGGGLGTAGYLLWNSSRQAPPGEQPLPTQAPQADQGQKAPPRAAAAVPAETARPKPAAHHESRHGESAEQHEQHEQAAGEARSRRQTVPELTIGVVDEVMRGAQGTIARCFRDTEPRRLTVDAMILPSGAVHDITTDVTDDSKGCVESAVRRLRFPASQSTEPVTVHYEFVNLHK